MPLLIHSLSELAPIILPTLEIAGCKTVTEIGSEGGGMTALLLEFVKERGGWMTSIDPAPSQAVADLLNGTPFGILHRDVSLKALPLSPPTDAYLVDGDHNYFTVIQELLWIERLQKAGGKPFFAVLHDVGWPWAYRDLYYNPDLIPEAWRQPYTWERGVTLDEPAAIEGGFRGCGKWACAVQEGGEKNGVLKAVEDFVLSREGLQIGIVPAVFGLGIIYSGAAPWAPLLTEYLAPYHGSPLLAKLERNRLENYLRVIQLEDKYLRPPTSQPAKQSASQPVVLSLSQLAGRTGEAPMEQRADGQSIIEGLDQSVDQGLGQITDSSPEEVNHAN